MTNRLKRVTDLFTEGRVVELGKDPQGLPVLVWVHKLNSFEEDTVRADALAGRQIRMVELRDNPTDGELCAVRLQLESMTEAALINNLLDRHNAEDHSEAIDDVESLPKWQDRIDLVRRSAEILADSEENPKSAKAKAVKKAVEEYNQDIEAHVKAKRERRQDVLRGEPREKLIEENMDATLEMLTMRAFFIERQITEIWLALRDCQALLGESGEYDHSECTHKRLLDDRSEVRALPQEILTAVTTTINALSVPDREAGNSEGPSSSSDSSAPQKSAEDSKPSSPEETPGEPVAISSSP
jgi:hypothetical protein